MENRNLMIDIESFSDETFDIDSSVNEAKTYIEELIKDNRWLVGDFEDDIWVLEHSLYKGSRIKFDFSSFNRFIFKHNQHENFVDIVKCWCVNNIKNYAGPEALLKPLIFAFENSQGFSENHADELIRKIDESNGTNHFKMTFTNALFNFFDFYESEINAIYIPKLIEYRSKINYKNPVRKLPPSREILLFSDFLERDFDFLINNFESDEDALNSLLTVYPIYIWWNLTNVIPMRANEFCSIERDCLFIKNGEYYIRLPRQKQKIRSNIQIIDELSISKELYEDIQKYIDITNKYGNSDTLISYRSLLDISHPAGNYVRNAMTRDKDHFGRAKFQVLLASYYKRIEKVFNYKFDKENEVSPNDTRHFAFISLMMQGFSPIEIARLGGHKIIESQYHYSYHTEYWVDCEVFKLMKKIKNNSSNVQNISDDIKMKALIVNNAETKIKMNIGYCTDIEQKCESSKCYFCSHWGIDKDEFLMKKEEIKNDIINMKSNLLEACSFMKNLHDNFIKDELSKRSVDNLNDIKRQSNKIKSDLYKIALLNSKIKGDYFNEK